MKKLSAEEKRVIVDKGTERAFTGIYNEHHESGIFLCKQCGQPLFSSTDKFDSGSGWPSFDDAIPGAVDERPDADGRRTEIVCAHCGAHLGHVFRGENMTPKSTRHCVNSISLDFEPEDSQADTATAIFAGGCFWGVEYQFQQVDGVSAVTSGYIGGEVENPTYEQVCSHDTGHAEAVRVTYDPQKVSYEELAKLFFEIHDPTQRNRQGPDHGSQYRSEVFCLNDKQKEIAQRLIEELREKGYDVVTQVSPAGEFYEAEEYHQDYYRKKGGEPYCHARQERF